MKNSTICSECCRIAVCVLAILCTASNSTRINFAYREFPYKETTKNEMTYREFETACAQSSACQIYNGLPKLMCIRKCMSPSCYQDLYQSDQLEEGEVDVRLNSFKGCFIQRYNRPRP